MFRENIGDNLRQLRKEQAGLSVAKVVDRINASGYEMSVDTYYKWERGSRKPPSEAIPYIAQALTTTEERIFHLHEKGQRVSLVCSGDRMAEQTGEDTVMLCGKKMYIPGEFRKVLGTVAHKKDLETYSIFFLAGMCAGMSQTDLKAVTSMLLHFYDDVKEGSAAR